MRLKIEEVYFQSNYSEVSMCHTVKFPVLPVSYVTFANYTAAAQRSSLSYGHLATHRLAESRMTLGAHGALAVWVFGCQVAENALGRSVKVDVVAVVIAVVSMKL